MMCELLQPTEKLAQSYVEAFRKTSGYYVTDQALFKLFHLFPTNKYLDEVLLKATTLNSLYATNILAIYTIAEHIHQCNIDTMLENHDPMVVEIVAKAVVREKVRRNYSFASKYCSFHYPDDYPIYDYYVDQLLWAYQRQDGFSTFRKYELFHDYTIYKNVVKDFRNYYGLTNLSLKEVDKFLWLYGKELYTQ